MRRIEGFNYKFSAGELGRFIRAGLITEEQRQEIVAASRKRLPGQFAERDEEIHIHLMNAADSVITLSSIHFYGGEHFGQPYHFVAELAPRCNRNVFTRWCRRHHLEFVLDKVAFTY